MNNNRFYKFGAIIGIGVIALVILFCIFFNKKENKVSETQDEFPSVASSTNIVEEGALSVEVEDEEFEEIASENTVESEKKQDENVAKQSKVAEEKDVKDSKKEETKKEEPKKEEIKKDPVFCYPVEGEIIMDYAKDKLVYSNTLGEWITHCGIDLKADKTTVVKASAEGTIKAIKNDPRYGLTVVIEHNNGFSTVYSNLLTAEFVSVGEKVTSGQTIGTVGNTASFEILEESHLHFEILKNNEQIDPNMYLKK